MALTCGVALSFMSCENQEFNDTYADAARVHVDTLSTEMQKVRDYVPDLAVVAHRGTTYWAPEETEAAYRWAREMGADYLEADLQVSKDGVILALHDTDLKRTTNIEDVFGERFPEKERRYFYETLLGYDSAKADSLIKCDKAAFVPNYPCSYTYYELLMLDAGAWFNEDAASAEQARTSFGGHRLYISTLEDLIMYSKGYRLARYGAQDGFATDNGNVNYWSKNFDDPTGQRVITSVELTNETINNPINFTTEFTVSDRVVKYNCEYVRDEHHSGNIPGIYIEFKEPWLNPSNFEEMVYNELAAVEDMNIIEKPVTGDVPFYTAEDKVNVGNTNGKVILQTFSLQSLTRVCDKFQGKVPMCFLLWYGTGATDLHNDSPQGYASFINLGVQYKAHYMGPCIAGAPNNYPELNKPWQHDMIHRAKMKNHPYSFDSYDQMAKYFGVYNWDNEGGTRYEAPYLDAFFTNHTDMSLQFMKDFGFRTKGVSNIPDARELLNQLGYTK
ncbi:MAG: glycerophosphodiester phosphodiesterase family protein [Marinifilaceae bacterium]|nr:glycerophosphodiester phosphodiesterase family protein [Marinifilaceae bacterium]